MCGLVQDNATRAAFHHHHLDPSTKKFKISSFPRQTRGMLLESAWRRVCVELSKTIYVCAFCHARIHYAERQLGRKDNNTKGVPLL